MINLTSLLGANRHQFHPVVPFDPATERISELVLTNDNPALTEEIYSQTKEFTSYINSIRADKRTRYLIGGYGEYRDLYKRSVLFDFEKKILEKEEYQSTEPRRLHLGTDIWGDAGTPILAPMGGFVHSFAYNNNFGDFGATIILQHNIDTTQFHTLYGHVSLRDFKDLREGGYFTRGQCIAHIGNELENGNWPPHLHFQIIEDMQLHEGDYPGVCRASEKDYFLSNCPNPDLMLNLMQYVKS